MNRDQLGTRITFRLSEEQERSMLEAMKRKHVTKASDFIRQAVLAEIERTLAQTDIQTSLEEILSKIQEKDKEAKTYALMQEINDRLSEIRGRHTPDSSVGAMSDGFGEPQKKPLPTPAQKP